MKFKKVEIQAFRAYDKVEDGTFDFRTGENEYADFVSIYAPNGFGKTSFYDAVEWGVTKNIHRLVQKRLSSDYAKSEKIENASIKHYVLRNRHSIPSLKSFVRLETTNSKIVGQELEEPRKGQSDFKFVKSKSYFQEVVLSQEWIDAFLKEDEPQARYQKFIDYFGDKDLDEYYKNIIALINANEENIKTIGDNLKGLQLDLKFDGDHNVLKTTNVLIAELRSKGEKLTDIDVSFTAAEAAIIAQTILKRVSETEHAVVLAHRQIDAVEIAFNGDEQLISFEEFIKIQQKVVAIEADIKEYQRLIEKFKGLGNLQNELANSEKTRTDKNKQIEVLHDIAEKLRLYVPIADQIAQLLKLQEEITIKTNDANTEERKLKGAETELQTKKTSLSYRLSEENLRLGNLPTLKLDWQKNNAEQKQVTDLIEKLKEPISTANEEQTTLENELRQLNSYVRAATINKEDRQIFSNTKYSVLSDVIDSALEAKHRIEEEIKQLNRTIDENENLNKDLQSLVSNGLEIIGQQSGTTSCPLCTTSFDTHQDLIDRIVNNNILPSYLQSLFKQRSELDKQSESVELTINTSIQNLILAINNDKELSEGLHEVALKKKTSLNGQLTELQTKAKKLKIEESNLNTQCPFSKIDEEEQRIRNVILNLNSEIENIIQAQKLNFDKLTEHRNEIKTQSSIKKDNEIQLGKLRNDPAYKLIVSYFAQHYPQAPISIGLINTSSSELEQDIKLVSDRVKTLNEAIENINAELTSKNRTSIEEELTIANRDLDENKRKLTAFEQSIRTAFAVAGEFSKIDLKTFLNNIRNNKKKEIEGSENIIAQFYLLRSLVDSVEPFLKFEKAKESEKSSKERVEYLKNVIKPLLEAERKKVSNHLDQLVNSFFYEEVINDIYSKIDPHPDYKKVKFKCDFSEDAPMLNVFVTEEKNERRLIPNLYFSTAQLNILSLSIFLAKALNAKDDSGNPLDCIFIDDPIQSMDSINILSTIDLIRSIVFNQKKQIVLSTHDDNFFSLLQKKIPPGKFKAKYIELETFGKVKRDKIN